jgi:hypothetical protein
MHNTEKERKILPDGVVDMMPMKKKTHDFSAIH